MKFETVIGLEIHAQLDTKTKMFCACPTDSNAAPNTNICPICLGYPGTLPTLNAKAVEYALRAGLALNCQIQKHSVLARKNYFYPDLPKGYQISQFELPLMLNGYLEIEINNQKKKIGITRIHIEEDAGKLIHREASALNKKPISLVDQNRAAMPLIEIVSEPDLRSPEEARLYMEKIHHLLLHLEICAGNLEQGNLRADANISLRPKGQKTLGTRTECKNLNSFKILEKALLAEQARQEDLLLKGYNVRYQTLRFDESSQKTIPTRSKEAVHDYRYFPEPDLLPLNLTQAQIDEVKNTMPASPEAKKEKYQTELGLNAFESTVLLSNLKLHKYFEACCQIRQEIPVKEIAKWVIGELNSLVKENKISFENCKVSPQNLIELLTLIQHKKISGKMAKDLLAKAYKTSTSPKTILKNSGLSQISDTTALAEIIQKVLNENQDVVAKIKAGKAKSIDYLIGQTMKATRGQAKPDLVKKIMLDKLS
jgi:aspartyl-tRNA(Asn)/glutamyl-tRNA(Gln) amidotransferase subunit B